MSNYIESVSVMQNPPDVARVVRFVEAGRGAGCACGNLLETV